MSNDLTAVTGTTIPVAWGNDVSSAIWGAIGTGRNGTPPSTPSNVRDNISVWSKAELADTTGAALIGFLQTGTGGLLRTLQSKGEDTVSVFEYLDATTVSYIRARNTASQNATTVTAAFNAALAARDRVHAPGGSYSLNGRVAWGGTATRQGYLFGDGTLGTILINTYANECLWIGIQPGVTAATVYNGGGVADLQIQISHDTAIGIRTKQCTQTKVQNIYVSGTAALPNHQISFVEDAGAGSSYFNHYTNLQGVGTDVICQHTSDGASYPGTQSTYTNVNGQTYFNQNKGYGHEFLFANGQDSVFEGGNMETSRKGVMYSSGYTGTFTVVAANATVNATYKDSNRVYSFTCTAAGATAGATYTSANGATFTVTGTIVAGTTLAANGTANPDLSGTLTKVTGTGDATITYSAFTTTNGNTFTVSSTIAGGTSLVCTGTGQPAASGILTKASGTGDTTIVFTSWDASTRTQGTTWNGFRCEGNLNADFDFGNGGFRTTILGYGNLGNNANYEHVFTITAANVFQNDVYTDGTYSYIVYATSTGVTLKAYSTTYAPPTGGVLTKTSGSGATPINYSAVTSTSFSPFRNRRNNAGLLIYSGADYSKETWVAQLTGCAEPKTYLCSCHKVGDIVTLNFLPGWNITATSNAVTKTLTGMPPVYAPTTPKVFYLPVIDNGGAITMGTLIVRDGTGVLELYPTILGSGNWTGAGTFEAHGNSCYVYDASL